MIKTRENLFIAEIESTKIIGFTLDPVTPMFEYAVLLSTGNKTTMYSYNPSWRFECDIGMPIFTDRDPREHEMYVTWDVAQNLLAEATTLHRPKR